MVLPRGAIIRLGDGLTPKVGQYFTLVGSVTQNILNKCASEGQTLDVESVLDAPKRK